MKGADVVMANIVQYNDWLDEVRGFLILNWDLEGHWRKSPTKKYPDPPHEGLSKLVVFTPSPPPIFKPDLLSY